MDDIQTLVQKYLAAKAQGVPDALNPNPVPPGQAPQMTGAPSQAGNIYLPSPSGAAPQAMPNLAAAYPDLSNAIMQGVPGYQPMPSKLPSFITPSTPPMIAEEEEPEQEEAEEPQAAPAPKQAAPAPAPAPQAEEKEEAEAKEPEVPQEPTPDKDKYSLVELQAKQAAARQTANALTIGMQAAATAGSVVGRPQSVEGYKEGIANSLGEAADYQKLIDEQRNDTIFDMQKAASNINLQRAQLDLTSLKAQSDKDSQISIAARGVAADLAGRLGIDPSKFEDLPYSAIQQMMPGIDKIVQTKLRTDMMAEAAQERNAAMQMRQQEMNETKEQRQEHQDDMLQKAIIDKMSPMIASSRTGLGRAKAVSMAAERIQAFLRPIIDNPDAATQIDMNELARQVDTMLSGGVGTMGGMKKLIPRTGPGDVAGIAQYLTGNLTGLNQGQFVQRLLQGARDEKNLADAQLQANAKLYKTGLEGTGIYNRRKQFIDNYIDEQAASAANDYTAATGNPSAITQALSNAQNPPPGAGAGMARVKAPDGTIRMVPQNMVQSAIAAGGVLQ